MAALAALPTLAMPPRGALLPVGRQLDGRGNMGIGTSGAASLREEEKQ